MLPEYDIVDPESEITVNLSGAIFMRLNQLVLTGLKESDPQKLIELTNKVKQGKDIKENSLEYHIETLLYISGMMSRAAVEQNKTKKFKFNTPNIDQAPQSSQDESKSE